MHSNQNNNFLKHLVEPVGVGKKTVNQLASEMSKIGFQGGNLGRVVDIWQKMLEEESITIWLGISGAIIPAGMRKLIAFLIKHRMVDVVVSTGAQLYHDLYEALGHKHYLGTHLIDDLQLNEQAIDRIYDVFVPEKEEIDVDKLLQDFVENKLKKRQYSSREYHYSLAKHCFNQALEKDSILMQAYRKKVPVYAPALVDSSVGYPFIIARTKGILRYVDQMKDGHESIEILNKSKKTGVIYLGGGVPKNYIQQTQFISYFIDKILGVKSGYQHLGHEYAIQITTDAPHWGGLSGCTFEEAQSWGKISKDAKKVQCFCDATIALPLVVNALAERCLKTAKKRNYPEFSTGNELKIKC